MRHEPGLRTLLDRCKCKHINEQDEFSVEAGWILDSPSYMDHFHRHHHFNGHKLDEATS
jgi:hypothetical protein